MLSDIVFAVQKGLTLALDISIAMDECNKAFHPTDESGIDVDAVSSMTPEDKYGLSGFDMAGTPTGERERFVQAGKEFYYKVDFWNKEDATAPAVDVLVKDNLDPNLDWSSFRFEDIGFIKWDVKLDHSQYFNANVDMRPDVNLIVNVEGTFDIQTGEVTWIFRSLDTNTLQTPEDPMAGFLPPITDTGEEVGWVGFNVKAKEGLATGTQIKNQAFVEFDWAGDINNHPAPKEGPWLNTIDSLAPTSHVLLLPDSTTSPQFTVEWAGDDADGSGIGYYDIYVSTDSNDYVLWLDDTNSTSAVFTGASGRTYAFYSIACDNVGNVEAPPSQVDATTTVASEISVKKCSVTASSKDDSDAISISGTIDVAPADITGTIVVKVGGVYQEEIPASLFKPKKGKYTYTHKVSKGWARGITSFVIDTRKGKFSLQAKKVDLTCLKCPFDVEIEIGNYWGVCTVEEKIVNGRRFIPIRLMSGCEDDLQVHSMKVRAGKKASTDSLYVKGGIAFENTPSAMSDVVLTWGGQTFTIPAGSFVPEGKSGLKYVCENKKVLEGGRASATFRFGKCTFFISIKGTTINAKSGEVCMSLAIGDFNERECVNLGD